MYFALKILNSNRVTWIFATSLQMRKIRLMTGKQLVQDLQVVGTGVCLVQRHPGQLAFDL